MTLEEAIERNRNTLCVPNSIFIMPKYQAIALGNEALKREVEMRESYPHIYEVRLPGETED